MKAIVYTKYGRPEVLHNAEVPVPTLKDHEVLVKVCASSINSWDWDMLKGSPLIIRMWGVFKPRHTIPGADVSGIIEAIGDKVTRWKVGDTVMGDLNSAGWGGFAEFAKAPESILVKKPKDMTFSQAAAIPQAGLLALLALRQIAPLQTGKRLLINGAGGGVGTIALQLAKNIGLHVTAVDTAAKEEALRQLGADAFIDYLTTDYTQQAKKFDYIIDVTARKKPRQYKKVLNRNGRMSVVGGKPSTLLRVFLQMIFDAALKRWRHPSSKKTIALMAKVPTIDELEELNSLWIKGEFHPVMDKEFPLEQTRNAFEYYLSMTFMGKIIIKIQGDELL